MVISLLALVFIGLFSPQICNPWISIMRLQLHRCQLRLGKHYDSLMLKVIKLSMLSTQILISLMPHNLCLEMRLSNTQVIVCTNPLWSQTCVGSHYLGTASLTHTNFNLCIKPSVYYSFHDYLAMLLSHKNLKGLMDNIRKMWRL